MPLANVVGGVLVLTVVVDVVDVVVVVDGMNTRGQKRFPGLFFENPRFVFRQKEYRLKYVRR